MIAQRDTMAMLTEQMSHWATVPGYPPPDFRVDSIVHDSSLVGYTAPRVFMIYPAPPYPYLRFQIGPVTYGAAPDSWPSLHAGELFAVALYLVVLIALLVNRTRHISDTTTLAADDPHEVID